MEATKQVNHYQPQNLKFQTASTLKLWKKTLKYVNVSYSSRLSELSSLTSLTVLSTSSLNG